MSSPRVLFIGGTPRGRRVLELLYKRRVNVVGVFVMQEDEHEVVQESSALVDLATQHGWLPTVTKKLSSDDVAAIVDLQPDLVLVVGWRTMISSTVYELPRLGCLGMHDSPLPRYRGFAPVNWAVINGEREWAVSLMHLAEGVDDGDLVGQEHFAVAERATAAELYQQVSDATVNLLDRHLDGLLDGTAPRTSQDSDSATFACARTPEDGRIDWSASTVEIDRLVRGLGAPYPGAWTTYKGERLIVWEADLVSPTSIYEGRIPGRPIRFTEGLVDVLTGDGMLRLVRVQLDGDVVRPAADVIRSIKTTLGGQNQNRR